MKLYAVNVVTYDGRDAYVMKFVLDMENPDDAKRKVQQYCLDGGMEVLKLDSLFPMTLKDVVAWHNEENYTKGIITVGEFNAAVRFGKMYFEI